MPEACDGPKDLHTWISHQQKCVDFKNYVPRKKQFCWVNNKGSVIRSRRGTGNPGGFMRDHLDYLCHNTKKGKVNILPWFHEVERFSETIRLSKSSFYGKLSHLFLVMFLYILKLSVI